jgi:hypothetical protein
MSTEFMSPTPNLAGVLNAFTRMWEQQRKDNPPIPGCPFKKGDRVKFKEAYFTKLPHMSAERDVEFLITSIVEEDENSYEMTLQGFPFMVYDEDVVLVYKPCVFCVSEITEGVNCPHCGGPQGVLKL